MDKRHSVLCDLVCPQFSYVFVVPGWSVRCGRVLRRDAVHVACCVLHKTKQKHRDHVAHVILREVFPLQALAFDDLFWIESFLVDGCPFRIGNRD